MAIVINNDIGRDEASKNDQDPEHVFTKKVTKVNDLLESLGFHVLYFSDLTSEIIDWLLTVLLQSDLSDLAAIAFIMFSKGKNPQLYDTDNNEISIEMIFNHFQKVLIPALMFLHMNYTNSGSIQLPDTPSNSVVLAVSHHLTEETSPDYIPPAIDIFANEMQSEAQPINIIFKRIETRCNMQKGISGLYKSTLGDHIILPAAYEAFSEL